MQKEDWTLNIGAAVFIVQIMKTVISFTCILNLMLLTSRGLNDFLCWCQGRAFKTPMNFAMKIYSPLILGKQQNDVMLV
jgi:hypothetical protein